MADDKGDLELTGPAAGSRGAPSRRIGDFELLRELGRGGMGIVFEARQISLNRRVALKVLPPGLGLTESGVARFRREAQAAAGLHHTNIVPVYAIGEEDGGYYYAMELIEGASLADVLEDLRGGRTNPLMEATVTLRAGTAPAAAAGAPGRPDARGRAGGARSSGAAGRSGLATSLPGSSAAEDRRWFDSAAHLIAEVADALHYAHGRGVIHRDIKPANLMLSREGRLCVTDFGLARITQEPTMTMSGLLMGSPAYMSPEQVAAGRTTLDHRTDVYSLGVVLYEMLTFRLPFLGDTREMTLSGILTKDPPRPRSLNPRVPVDLETICLKAMEKDPDRRYATAGDMAVDLRRFQQRGLIAARRAGPLRRAVKIVRRHPAIATGAVSAMALAILGALTWSASARAGAERAEKALVDAQLAMESGDLREGLRNVDAALAIDRTLPAARLLRARALLDLDRAPEAVAEARALLKANPDDLAAHLILARAAGAVPGISRDEEMRLLRERSRPGTADSADAYYCQSLLTDAGEEAVALLNRALDLDPGHAGALAARGSRLAALKRFQEALGDCDRLISVRPRSAIGRRLKANVLLGLGDDRRARTEIDRAIEIDRGDPASFIARGRMFCTGDRKSLDAAFADLDEAIRLDPANGRYFDVRAWCNFEFRRYEQAKDDALKAIELGRDGNWITTAYWRLAASLHRLGRDTEAREAAGRLQGQVEAWPDAKRRSEGFQSLAALYQDLGDSDRALEAIDRAVESAAGRWEPLLARARIRGEREDGAGKQADCAAAAAVALDEPGDLTTRAVTLRDVCGRFDLAIADHTRAIALAPDWGKAYLERGWTEVRAKEYEKGMTDYARCIELAPNMLRAYNARAYVLMNLERWEESLKDYDAAIALEPNRIASCNRAIPLQALGRVREAKAGMEKCLEYDPHDAVILTNVGIAASQLGDQGQALSYYQRAVDADPKAALARISLAGALAYANRCDDAAKEIEAARGLDLSATSVRSTLAQFLLVPAHGNCPRLTDDDQALAYARDLAKTKGWEAQSFGAILGLALYRKGLYKESDTALRDVVQPTNFDRDVALLVQSMVDQKLGRTQEARAHYGQAIALIDAKGEAKHDPDLAVLVAEARETLRL